MTSVTLRKAKTRSFFLFSLLIRTTLLLSIGPSVYERLRWTGPTLLEDDDSASVSSPKVEGCPAKCSWPASAAFSASNASSTISESLISPLICCAHRSNSSSELTLLSLETESASFMSLQSSACRIASRRSASIRTPRTTVLLFEEPVTGKFACDVSCKADGRSCVDCPALGHGSRGALSLVSVPHFSIVRPSRECRALMDPCLLSFPESFPSA